MNKRGNPEALKKASSQRTLDSRKKAYDAIQYYKRNGFKINYQNIADCAGVSRNFLYTDEVISEIMLKICKPGVPKSADSKDVVISAQKRKIKELENQIKEIEANENWKEKYQDLQDEISELKKQLKKSYSFE